MYTSTGLIVLFFSFFSQLGVYSFCVFRQNDPGSVGTLVRGTRAHVPQYGGLHSRFALLQLMSCKYRNVFMEHDLAPRYFARVLLSSPPVLPYLLLLLLVVTQMNIPLVTTLDGNHGADDCGRIKIV